MGPMDSKYHVGDKVVIGNTHSCKWGFNHFMKEMCGRVMTIKRVEWSTYKSAYKYKLLEDLGDWSWDDSCFEPAVELPEFDVSGVNVLELIS